MAQFLTSITPRVERFIAEQHLFFVATAARDGQVNVSPKGLDTLRVVSPNRVAWLNGTGSGNETAAHVLDIPRMTIMFCALEGNPWIVRLYGRPTMVQPPDEGWEAWVSLFPPLKGARQVFVLDIDRVITSCGFGVPLFAYERQRTTMDQWFDKLGPDRVQEYQREKNVASIDGLPTDLRQA